FWRLSRLDNYRYFFNGFAINGKVDVTSVKTAVGNNFVYDTELLCIYTRHGYVIVPRNPSDRIRKLLQPWVVRLLAVAQTNFGVKQQLKARSIFCCGKCVGSTGIIRRTACGNRNLCTDDTVVQGFVPRRTGEI